MMAQREKIFGRRVPRSAISAVAMMTKKIEKNYPVIIDSKRAPTVAFVEELIGRKLEQTKVLVPHGFVVAVMKIEKMREQVRVWLIQGPQLLLQARGLVVTSGPILWWLFAAEHRAGQTGVELFPFRFEPLAQP